MKNRMLTAVLLLTLILSGCASGEASPNAGLWTAHSVSVWGAQQPAPEVFAGGFTIDLKSGGKAVITMDHVSADAVWTLKDGLFTISGGGLDASGTLEGEKMVLQDVVGIGSSVSLYKEGAELPPIASAPPAAPAPVPDPAPQTPAEPAPETAAVKGFDPPARWTGVIRNENIEGDFRFPETVEVEGILNVDEPTGRPYFDVWMVDENGEEISILSMYIDLYPDHFVPVIGDGDAWLYYRDLEPQEASLFRGVLQEGEMVFVYKYAEEDGTTADVEIRMIPE